MDSQKPGEKDKNFLHRIGAAPESEPPTAEEAKELRDERLKGDFSGESAVATPETGRTSIDEIKQGGPRRWLQILGPGLITGASDDDPSGIGTYSQVGSQFGYGLLWMAPFTYPLMWAVQELCARVALQTGVGMSEALKKKFPAWVVALSVLALLIANTINIGADLGAVAAAGSMLTGDKIPAIWLIVPVAAAILFAQVYLTYTLIFKIFKWLTLALFAYVLAAFLSNPNWKDVAIATLVPHIEFSQDFMLAIVAVLGTTISPYLFFWQAASEVEEKKAAGQITRRERHGATGKELAAARIDIAIGMFFSQIVMYFIILTTSATLNAHGVTNIESAPAAAAALQPIAGDFAFILFAAGLIGTGMLAIPILAGSAAYALKDLVGMPGSLAIQARYAPTFYAVITFSVIIGAVINFLGINPIEALFYAAVINGLLAPVLLVFITLLGSDREIMGERANGRLSSVLSWTATSVMSLAAVGLIVLSFM